MKYGGSFLGKPPCIHGSKIISEEIPLSISAIDPVLFIGIKTGFSCQFFALSQCGIHNLVQAFFQHSLNSFFTSQILLQLDDSRIFFFNFCILLRDCRSICVLTFGIQIFQISIPPVLDDVSSNGYYSKCCITNHYSNQ